MVTQHFCLYPEFYDMRRGCWHGMWTRTVQGNSGPNFHFNMFFGTSFHGECDQFMTSYSNLQMTDVHSKIQVRSCSTYGVIHSHIVSHGPISNLFR